MAEKHSPTFSETVYKGVKIGAALGLSVFAALAIGVPVSVINAGLTLTAAGALFVGGIATAYAGLREAGRTMFSSPKTA